MKSRISCPFPGCNEDYSDPSSLTRHKKKHHPGSCPPDGPKRIVELSGSSSSSSSSRHATMINTRSEVPRRSNVCCACHVKLESATSDSLGHSVLHTKSSSVTKTDLSSLCFPDATLQAFTPTFDLESQLLNAVPDFHMNHDIPTVAPLKPNHFVPHSSVNPSSSNDLLLCKSVFETNPSMSQYAADYNTTPQTSRSVSNYSHPTAMGSVVTPRSINAGSTASSFAVVQPSYDIPNYDANFNHMHPGPSTNLSQMQGQYRINIPQLDFDYSSYSHWLSDAELNAEGMFSL